MSTPDRDLAKLLDQVREENRHLRDRWASLKRLVLGEWKRGTKMPYSIVRPFIDGSGGVAVTAETEDDQQEDRSA